MLVMTRSFSWLDNLPVIGFKYKHEVERYEKQEETQVSSVLQKHVTFRLMMKGFFRPTLFYLNCPGSLVTIVGECSSGQTYRSIENTNCSTQFVTPDLGADGRFKS